MAAFLRPLVLIPFSALCLLLSPAFLLLHLLWWRITQARRERKRAEAEGEEKL